MTACHETTLAALMAQSARDTRRAMRRAGMLDGFIPAATARKPPGRARLPATDAAEQMLRQGASMAEVHRETRLSMCHVRHLRRLMRERAEGCPVEAMGWAADGRERFSGGPHRDGDEMAAVARKTEGEA